MEMEASTKHGLPGQGCHQLKSLTMVFATKVAEVARNARKLAKDDPRRVTHALKVGLALTLVSVMYYLEPVYKNFHDTAIWTVMTVVVVFEFSVGATLSKGLNRAAATLLAGGLGVGAHHLASLAGETAEPILLAFFVFLLATTSTFFRFFPKIKARHDYGMLIFILTFCLVSVSGFREEEVLEMANNRLSTVFIGGALCVIISIGMWPVYAGEDLHNLIALNMEKLGTFLEGFGDEYFKTSANGEDNNTNGSRSLQGYKSVLGSKSTEESLANLARWEPSHGKFQFRHPWQQYLKLGVLIRQCAYRFEALDGHLNTDDNKAPPQVREHIEEAFKNISSETGKALKELAAIVKTMIRQQNLDIDLHLENSRNGVKKLKALLKDGLWKDEDFLTILPCVTVASLLIEVVECTEKMAEAVHELASLAKFKAIDPTNVASPEKRPSARIEPVHDLGDDAACPHVVLMILLDEPMHALPESESPHAAPVAPSMIRAATTSAASACGSVNVTNKHNEITEEHKTHFPAYNVGYRPYHITIIETCIGFM